MTTKTQKIDKKGKRPTHMLFAKSENFNPPVNIKIGAVWEHTKGEGMNLALDNLRVKLDQDKYGETTPSLFVQTKIYGQPCEVEIGHFSANEDDNSIFELNLGDLVAFKTKPREDASTKTASKSQPKP